jgi:hypothetical protein
MGIDLGNGGYPGRGSTVCHKTGSIVSPCVVGATDEYHGAKKIVAVHDDGIVEIISPFAFTFKIPFH